MRVKGRAPAWLALALAGLLGATAAAQQAAPDFDEIAAAAAAARNQGDTGAALRLYSQAVALNPQWPDGWWFLGVMQYGANQFAPARDALDHFIELKPEGGAAIALRGLCEFETGQYPEALADLQRGISLGAAAQPRNAEILRYHEALLLTRLGDFEKALGRYSSFVKDFRSGDFRSRDASSGPRPADELAAAIGLAGLRMPIFPRDADPAQAPLIAATGAAALAFMGGDFDGARLAFERLFASYPKTGDIHYLYGYLLFPTRPAAAIAQFQQEIAISPRNAIANAMLAWAYGIQGDYQAALPAARIAAQEDPSMAVGQLMLGRALVETGRTAEGLPHLETVLQLEPGSLEAHLTLAKAYSKLGRKDDAWRERQRCLQISGGGAAPNDTP